MEFPVKLAIVIVNYRTADLVVDCLDALAVAGTVPENTKIVVVDGASGDGSAEKIGAVIENAGWSDRISLLALDINGGFACGNNRGLDYAVSRFGSPEYVLFLNPDTVPRPGSLLPLVLFMDANPQAGIAGSRLEDRDGTPQACAFRFPSPAGEFESQARFGPVTRLLKQWRISHEASDVPFAVDWVSGASMMVRMALLDQIGPMDENYFLYYEELDLCLRAGRAGWQCWHVPKSRVVHLVGQSTGVTVRERRSPRRPAYWFDSRRRYYSKHHGRLYAACANSAWIMGQTLWRCRQMLQRRPEIDPPHLLSDFIRHIGPSRLS